MKTPNHQGEDTTRVIGLIGGMSWESSAEYYKLINQEVRRRLGPLRSARLLMYSVDFGPIQQAQHTGCWDETAQVLQDAARRLHRGGADCVMLCTNTMHKLAERVAEAAPIPFLHIADPVGAAAKQSDIQTLGLLGTLFTMEEPFMRDYLESRYGLNVLVPEKADRDEVHRIIYEELCAGQVQTASRQTCQRIIESLAQCGGQAVVLGCTEIMLLIGQHDSKLPLLDTTSLHAQAAVDFALGDTGRTTPAWPQASN